MNRARKAPTTAQLAGLRFGGLERIHSLPLRVASFDLFHVRLDELPKLNEGRVAVSCALNMRVPGGVCINHDVGVDQFVSNHFATHTDDQLVIERRCVKFQVVH